jgi:hypothetical protein
MLAPGRTRVRIMCKRLNYHQLEQKHGRLYEDGAGLVAGYDQVLGLWIWYRFDSLGYVVTGSTDKLEKGAIPLKGHIPVKLESGDEVKIWVYRDWYPAWVLATYDDQALLEYETNQGWSVLWLVKRDWCPVMNPGRRTISYFDLPENWLLAIRRQTLGDFIYSNPRRNEFGGVFHVEDIMEARSMTGQARKQGISLLAAAKGWAE